MTNQDCADDSSRYCKAAIGDASPEFMDAAIGYMNRQTYIVFLRAVMPSGPNSIPSMPRLRGLLEDAGFGDVRTYLHTGNITLTSDMGRKEVADHVVHVIRNGFGADLNAIVKTLAEVEFALSGSPFRNVSNPSESFIVFTNDEVDECRRRVLCARDWGMQGISFGEHAIYLHSPFDARPKTLSNTYIERKLGIVSTMRNIRVVSKVLEISTTRRPVPTVCCRCCFCLSLKSKTETKMENGRAETHHIGHLRNRWSGR